MKRTRRAALAAIVGSSSVLAVETIGFSNAGVDRDVRLGVVTDADAYLGLSANGIEERGPPFEGTPRRPPAAFDIVNQLPEPITVTLAVDEFRFGSADGVDVSADRLVVGESEADRLGPGERIERVTVELDPQRDGPAGNAVTGTIEIDVEGDETRIEAERELTLERPAIAVDSARLEPSPSGNGVVEHEWRLRGVETDGVALERLGFDYSDLETADGPDFTDADELSVSVTVDGSERAASIERRTSAALEIALESPVSVDSDPVAVVLTNTGPPASPGGENRSPSGAVVELAGGGDSRRVEVTWRRP